MVAIEHQPNNLPLQLTRFVGRNEEIAAVRRLLLRPDVRLVTLTGPGGTGKTRLSLQVAADVLDDFPDGVYFVNLALLHDPTLVSITIAQTLGIREGGDRAIIESLKDWLRDRRVLLVLDNWEHLVAAAPLVTDLLTAAPNLKRDGGRGQDG
jgi:predicted ATPase